VEVEGFTKEVIGQEVVVMKVAVLEVATEVASRITSMKETVVVAWDSEVQTKKTGVVVVAAAEAARGAGEAAAVAAADIIIVGDSKVAEAAHLVRTGAEGRTVGTSSEGRDLETSDRYFRDQWLTSRLSLISWV
jgi:hypothetical protein